jgi:hypothetical protein
MCIYLPAAVEFTVGVDSRIFAKYFASRNLHIQKICLLGPPYGLAMIMAFDSDVTQTLGYGLK